MFLNSDNIFAAIFIIDDKLRPKSMKTKLVGPTFYLFV